MSRYIDADAYKNVFEKLRHRGISPQSRDVKILRNYLDEFPTADVVRKEKYDELNDRYHRLLESANILADAVRDYERRDDVKIH